MLIYVDPAKHGHERDFTAAIAGTLHRLGHDTTRSPRRDIAAAVVWNGRGWPRGRCPTLYVECGWLPRWWYQVSHRGINADHHAAPIVPVADMTAADQAELAAHIELCRAGNPYNWPYLRRCEESFPDSLPERFILVPLQIESDTNMRHVAPERRTVQGLVDWCVRQNPALPLVFKNHPAEKKDRHLQHLRPGDIQFPALPWTVHDLLRSGRVAALWTANSNSVHDAMLWGVPAQALDAGIWGASIAPAEPLPLAYLLALSRAQWSLEDARNPETVRAALDRAIGEFEPAPTIEVTGATTVNVCLGNRGWLFQDLAMHLARMAPMADCRVVVSERPEPNATAYIYLRADDARNCPHPERAVCQVHDQWGNWHGRYNGARLAGWSLTHPDQDAMLRRYVDLRGKARLIQPLGAPGDWKPRQAFARDTFTVAWVGRAVAFKRVDWFVQACSDVWRQIPGFKAVMLGQNCEPFIAELQRRGVPCELRTKAEVGFDRYEGQYHGFDCVVICSNPDGDGEHEPRGEAHPMPLFEALACGVPVVSSHVGYADWLAPYLFIGPKGLRECIVDAYRNRERDFARRHELARRARQYGTLESWCVANLRFAIEVAARVGRSGC
jgi:glycosyltransferase involved in cell wall biosynthesis